MIFRRKIYDTLIKWEKSNSTKALLIKGTKSIEKSTIAVEFSKITIVVMLLSAFKKHLFKLKNDLIII